MVGDIGGDFTFGLLRNNTKLLKAFGGRVDGGTTFINAFGDFGRRALTMLDKIEIYFGLNFSEASLS